MNTRLSHIQNWTELAQQAKWSASALAKKCGITVRTLERYFLRQMNKSPKAWLAEQRQRRAVELLRDGSSVKETATCLGYKQPTNFTRKYKKHWGFCPANQTPRIMRTKPANVAK
jgi:transcriptional regulator GlxA family with amidase domain